MNVNTGEIRTFETADAMSEAIATGNWVALGKTPKASCKRCYGRGYIGRNDQGKFVPCNCVKPNR